MKRWGDQYKANPTDHNAVAFHAAWCDMRAAVDELVDIPRQDEWVMLATKSSDPPPSGPEGT